MGEGLCQRLAGQPSPRGTFADASVLVEVVAKGTFTLEAAKGVHTVATLAEAWQLLALVNV